MIKGFFAFPTDLDGDIHDGYKIDKEISKESVQLSNTFLFDSINGVENFRKAFFKLTFPFKNVQVLDFGRAQNAILPFEIKQEIVEVNKKLLIQIQTTLPELSSTTNTLVFSPSLNESTVQNPDNVTLAAYQRHLCNLEHSTIKSVSLGSLIDNISSIEPEIRKSKTLIIDLNCIKASDLMQPSLLPCGLSILDMCKIARYAGFSDNLEQIHIVVPHKMNEIQQNSIALILWYLFEGRDDFLELNKKTHNLTSYILASGELDLDFEFLKDENSNKWWVKNPSDPEQKIPCNYSDYEKALNGEDPTHLLSLFDVV